LTKHNLKKNQQVLDLCFIVVWSSRRSTRGLYWVKLGQSFLYFFFNSDWSRFRVDLLSSFKFYN
jgi:hypothetical protein